MQDSRRKILMIQKSALMEEIILRLGDDGEKLLVKLADLSSELDEIENKALFRASVQLGTKLAHPGAEVRPHPTNRT